MQRAKRICPKTGCPKPATGRYCPEHNREYEQQRGSATQRGYDAAHRRERARWVSDVMDGRVTCPKCGNTITPGQRWDLGHTDDRAGWTGPEHAGCNRADGGRKAHRYT